MQCSSCLGITMQVCSACRSIPYCSQGCQKVDWKSHRQLCKTIANEMKQGVETSVVKLAWKLCDIPGECFLDDAFPITAKAQARALRVKPVHLQTAVAIMLPEHPLVERYMQWHASQEQTELVPIRVASLVHFQQAYGTEAVLKVMQSLCQDGPPWSIWHSSVAPKWVSFVIRKLNGDSLDTRCPYDYTVSRLKREISSWALSAVDEETLLGTDMTLSYSEHVMLDCDTISYVGLSDGGEVQLVLDQPPPLVCSSDNE